MTSLDKETGRDRYFAAKERELDELLDPETGMLSERFAKRIDCPSCGSASHSELFVKRGYPIVRCDECALVFSNPQVDESVVLDEYREGGSNDLWVDVLTSPRQLELDREKFAEILDELEPHRGDGRLLDVGTSIGLFLRLALDRGWTGRGTEFGQRALAYARDELGLEVDDTPIEAIDGVYDVVTVLSVLEHVNRPREFLGHVSRLLRPGGPRTSSCPTSTASRAASCTSARRRSTAGTISSTSRRAPCGTCSSVRGSRSCARGRGSRRSSRCSSGSPTASRTRASRRRTTLLVRAARAERAEVERLLEELDLGYKLHCLAVKPE